MIEAAAIWSLPPPPRSNGTVAAVLHRASCKLPRSKRSAPNSMHPNRLYGIESRGPHRHLLTDADRAAGSAPCATAFLKALGEARPKRLGESSVVRTPTPPVDADARQQRQVQELVDHTQRLLQLSSKTRDKLWSKADRSTSEKWGSCDREPYRTLVWDELIGRITDPVIVPQPRSRKFSMKRNTRDTKSSSTFSPT